MCVYYLFAIKVFSYFIFQGTILDNIKKSRIIVAPFASQRLREMMYMKYYGEMHDNLEHSHILWQG